MSEDNLKQSKQKDELLDETLEKVSGGWIQLGRDVFITCQLLEDDALLLHYNEGENNTCQSFIRKPNYHGTSRKCSYCAAYIQDGRFW